MFSAGHASTVTTMESVWRLPFCPTIASNLVKALVNKLGHKQKRQASSTCRVKNNGAVKSSNLRPAD